MRRSGRWRVRLGVAGCLALLPLLQCKTPQKNNPPPDNLLSLEIDKSDPQTFLRYYFGPFTRPRGEDPFRAGLLVEQGGRYFLNLDSLAAFPDALGLLKQAAEAGSIGEETLEHLLERAYYAAVSPPENLDLLRQTHGYLDSTDAWFWVEIDGVMTTARRHVYVPRTALRDALSNYAKYDSRIVYPVGTILIGEHHQDGQLVETTVMRKTSDTYWEFFVYGPDGALSHTTRTAPRRLKVPVQCVGCHTGSRLFEPEKSFPGMAPPGPEGKRHLYVDEALRNGEVVAFFNEHRRRGDAVLGIYATLYVADLLQRSRSGRFVAPEDRSVLARIGVE
ncbi:hypothetical protein GQ464_018515 [Rhodocaloribacter litoris]|uniref:cytochrome P460 family protein n=1 Tax=Rhodocaloribacter litoris TaxID=2558931 RepID=UPI00141FA971|nr:cytochrome P460 family protein [Rhodocaloribacter litoris]QXD15357.1 hypothetical protein GQ464_018515 [Rhodocaloribacter litoris]